ncbi:glycosyltransferase family 2 protein, partial [Dolosigranulum pigrum]
MPAYNAATFIQETIQSVINQTYQNWELLIVDDASTDNTIDKIRS